MTQPTFDLQAIVTDIKGELLKPPYEDLKKNGFEILDLRTFTPMSTKDYLNILKKGVDKNDATDIGKEKPNEKT